MEAKTKIAELIAVGASIAANCQPCLRSHLEKAVKAGANREEVAAAMEIGERVKKGAAATMEEFSAALKKALPPIEMGVVMEGDGRQFLGP